MSAVRARNAFSSVSPERSDFFGAGLELARTAYGGSTVAGRFPSEPFTSLADTSQLNPGIGIGGVFCDRSVSTAVEKRVPNLE